MKTRNEEKSSRRTRGSILGAIGAALALIASALVPTAALAAPPQAGTYEGTSTAYTDATFSFDIDANGLIDNFNTTSNCYDGLFTQPVIWAGGPSTPIEAGQPFNLEWEYTLDGFGMYYELSGTVNADGTASGTGRAGFLPPTPCGGMSFNWSASISGGGGDPTPQGPEIITEKDGYYDYEIQRVGIMIRGEGFPANTDVEVTIHQVNNGEERYREVVRSDANGEVYHRYVGWLEHQTLNGLHDIKLSAEVNGEEFSDEKRIRANPGGNGTFFYFHDREMNVTPQSISQSELATEGVRIESVDMDGREDTAELIINGKGVGQVPVADIGDEFGGVDYQFTDASLLPGEHEVALRTIHVSGEMNQTTWERVAWDTFTVTEDPDPTPVTPVEPSRAGNTVTIPNVEGLTYRNGSGTVLSGSVTLIEGQTLSVTATANDGYVLTDDVSEWTFTYEAPDPIEVTAEAPTRTGNTVTIPVVDGVTYVDASDNVRTDSVTLVEGETLTVTATADDGYVLAGGTHEWTFAYEAPEPVEVTAEAPTRDGNTVTIPVVTGVTYVDGAGEELSGSVNLTEGQPLTVIATADDGYVLADGAAEWSFTYQDDDPDLTEVTAAAPTRDGNTVTIPVVEGVTYVDGSDAELSGSVTLTEGQALTVRATADDGYELADGTHEWTFTFEEEGPTDPVTIPAAAPVEGDLDPLLEGDITAPDTAKPGETITLTIEGAAEGDEVGIWFFSDPVYLGAHTVNADGTVTATIPADAAEGDHKIAAWAAGTDEQIGWDSITVTAADGGGDDQNGGSGGDDQGGAGDTDGTGGDGADDRATTGASDGSLAATGASGMGLAAGLGLLLVLASAGLLLMHRRRSME